MITEEQVVLVDTDNSVIGRGEKLAVHRAGQLHRAFSIFIFNNRGELLLQRRALSKYHSGGLWTNTCCGHQRPTETLEQAAVRRLKEEMGIDCRLEEKFSFIYQAPLDNELTEHEYDHVFFGRCDNDPTVDPGEVMEWRWQAIPDLRTDMKQQPEAYTHWFNLIMEREPDIFVPDAAKPLHF